MTAFDVRRALLVYEDIFAPFHVTATRPLQEALDKKGISCCVVGDAAAIGRAFDAVHQGAAAGRRI